MANQFNGSIDINFTDSRKADPSYQSGINSQASPIANYAETEDIASIRAALKTFDSFTYTDRELDCMTVNDMVFAWRACRGNNKSISDSHPAQIARTS